MTQIILIRHGETLWNTQGRIQGHLDSPLTQMGFTQARILAERFKSEEIAALYSSDLGRAYDTARCISEIKGLPVLSQPCLRERNFGILQGVQKKTLESQFPETFRYYQSHDPDYVIPDGESLKQFSQRCVECIEKLVQEYAGKRILVVAHSGVLVSLFKHTLALPVEAPRSFVSSNTSVNVFSYQNGKWMLEVWGDLSHLHGGKSLDDDSSDYTGPVVYQ